MNSYMRFVVTIVVSTIVMFALMYLNTDQLDHAYLSQTRAFMALIMGAAMAAIMLGFMPGMYPTVARISVFSPVAPPSSSWHCGSCGAKRLSTTWRG
jgi:uncharacterized membrane protein YdjX (TVP38/TMEM64 family)